MFSELCRETLRKAAVCYNSGRSSSASPSPPSSPPPSPSRLVETRDVGCLSRAHDPYEPQGLHFYKRSTSHVEFRECRKRAATPTNVSSRRTSGLESRDGRRPPYALSFDCSLFREPPTQQRPPRLRRGRSASPEMLRPAADRYSPDYSDPDSSGDEAGAAPDDNSQRPGSAHNRHSLAKDLRRRSSQFDADSLDGDHPCENEGRDSTSGNGLPGSSLAAKDLDRARLVRERQNDERQRKLEELRQQALAAQRFREQREEDRRRRIEELRLRDNDRRSQVEERKRQIWEAERERREAIMRKNQEREARIEAKRKNERSHIVFAFGSSTPRMLEPADTGGSSFWGSRRATSTTNVMVSSFSAAQPLTRRSSERELDGSKKRATSAGGLDRKPGEGVRSGEVTPSSPSRPHSSMSQQSGTSSVASSSVNLRPRSGTPRRPRPASIAGTGMSVSYTERTYTSSEAKAQKDSKPPLPKVHSSSSSSNGGSASKKPTAASTTPGAKLTGKPSGASRSARASPRVTPRATPLQSPGIEHPPMLVNIDLKELKLDEKPEIIQESTATETMHDDSKKVEIPVNEPAPAAADLVVAAAEAEPAVEPPEEESVLIEEVQPTPPPATAEQKDESKIEKKSPEPEIKLEGDLDEQCDMTASMIQKIRITTEEEAKAALAERRRLAREQAEREAELERQRLEEEARLEAERVRAEEEEQRRLEEETLRLAEEAREAEEQRLQQAIEEATKREEEDRKRREEEARQKLEKEEAERKAREEAEKQRLEMVERLKKEEEERNARRKRVEAIMSRTRAKNQPNAQKNDGNDGEKSKEDSPIEENKPSPGEKAVQDLMTTSLISEATQQFISGEQLAHIESNNADEPSNGLVRNGTHANGIGDASTKPLLDNDSSQQELNGHHNNSSHGNGIDSQTIALDNATVKQNNVTNNLLDLSEFDTLSNSNSGPILLMQPSPVGLTGDLMNEDNLNSNLNPTAIPFTPNFGMSNSANSNPFGDAFTNKQDNQVQDLLS